MRIERPGFFDLQANGFAGVDYNDLGTTSEDVLRSAEAMRRTGVTGFLPTLITSSLEHFAACARVINNAGSGLIAGIHMEGPYISPEEGPRGAHPLAAVASASLEDFLRRQEAAQGLIKLVTLAPEVPGALPLVQDLVERGVRVAIGHTGAAPEQIRDAVSAGATLATHLGNGCARTLPRHPNFLWEQLAADDLLASFIVDGHHLPPATVKAMIRAKTANRSILVTDAIGPAGCPPGEYQSCGWRVVLREDGWVGPPDKPWPSGSSLTLALAVANTVRFTGLDLDTVWPMASTIPAEYLGLKPRGRISAEWCPRTCILSDLKILN